MENKCRVVRGDAIAYKVWMDLRVAADTLETTLGVRVRLAIVVAGPVADRMVLATERTLAVEMPKLELRVVRLTAEATTADLVRAVDDLSNDESVHAISVQLPLPDGVHTSAVLRALPAHKDADGLSDANFKGTPGSPGHRGAGHGASCSPCAAPPLPAVEQSSASRLVGLSPCHRPRLAPWRCSGGSTRASRASTSSS